MPVSFCYYNGKADPSTKHERWIRTVNQIWVLITDNGLLDWWCLGWWVRCCTCRSYPADLISICPIYIIPRWEWKFIFMCRSML